MSLRNLQKIARKVSRLIHTTSMIEAINNAYNITKIRSIIFVVLIIILIFFGGKRNEFVVGHEFGYAHVVAVVVVVVVVVQNNVIIIFVIVVNNVFITGITLNHDFNVRTQTLWVHHGRATGSFVVVVT